MNQHELQKVITHNHLGIVFSNNGLWHDHIDYIVDKAYKRLNIMRKFRFTLYRFTSEKIYLTYIRQILEYGDVIWDYPNHSLVIGIENVQLEAARIFMGGTKSTSLKKLYDETGWEKLFSRRENHKLIMLYKIINKNSPAYLQNMLPSLVSDRHTERASILVDSSNFVCGRIESTSHFLFFCS